MSEVGRPTLYKPEYVKELIEYFDVEPYREVEKKITTKSGNVIEVMEDVANDFPTLAGFAVKIGVHRDTLHEWTTKHQDFSDAYARAKDFQENYLAVNGNKGLINAHFGMFTAKNILKWRDKQPDEAPDTVVNNNTLQVSQDQLNEMLKIARGDK